MRLISSDGAAVELKPISYEFPTTTSDRGGSFDHDANWLIIEGDVQTGDGRKWSFRDPCLLTTDAQQLAEWLEAAASKKHARPR